LPVAYLRLIIRVCLRERVRVDQPVVPQLVEPRVVFLYRGVGVLDFRFQGVVVHYPLAVVRVAGQEARRVAQINDVPPAIRVVEYQRVGRLAVDRGVFRYVLAQQILHLVDRADFGIAKFLKHGVLNRHVGFRIPHRLFDRV